MRIPVTRVYGKAKHVETAEDILANLLGTKYAITRGIFIGKTTDGFTADLAIQQHKIVLEIQQKQNDKNIMIEMTRERIAREEGWTICRLTVDESKDANDARYRINREIQRSSGK